MPDTIRKKADVLALLPINITGAIGAQDIRDTVASLYSARVANVYEYGADPTGTNDSTAAFQAAIDDVAAAGGGCVLVPRCPGSPNTGLYKVTQLIMKSEVTLMGTVGMVASRIVCTGTGTGFIEFASGTVTHANLINLSLSRDAASTTSWGIYAQAQGTGGWCNSALIDVTVTGFDNSLWLRGGATGSSLPIRNISMLRVFLSRTRNISASINLKITGHVERVQMDQIRMWTSDAWDSNTAYLGTGLVIDSEGTPAGYRVPMGIEANMFCSAGHDKTALIAGGQNITIKTAYLERTRHGFDISGHDSVTPTEVVQLISPRFAAIALSSVVDGYLVKAGANSMVHATDVWASTSCVKPFVSNGSNGLRVQFATMTNLPAGFNTRTTTMTPTLAVGGTGTAATLTLANNRTIVVTGDLSKSVSKIFSFLLPGESATGVVATNPLTLNSTDAGKNIQLPRAVTTITIPVDGHFKITRVDAISGVDYLVEFTPVAATVTALAGIPTLTQAKDKMNELILALQSGNIMK